MSTFCTYFDSNFADRGLCLWASLRKHMPNARLFVLCLDEKVFEVLTSLDLGSDLKLIRVAEVERLYPQLKTAKETRSKVEYIFTLTPSCIRFVFDSDASLQEVTYLDSDLLFFSSPAPLFQEMSAQNASVGIIGHRFTTHLQHLRIYGTYNVGWVTFRRTPSGMACLHDWQARCIEWCHDKVDGDRFADQRYLDNWASQFDGVVEIVHPGANVALWNLDATRLGSRRGRLYVDGSALIFYHFHGLSQFGAREFFTNARAYDVQLNEMLRHQIYGLYMYQLRRAQKRLRNSNINPLIRYSQTEDDIEYSQDFPETGLFLTSVGKFGLHRHQAQRKRWQRIISVLDTLTLKSRMPDNKLAE